MVYHSVRLLQRELGVSVLAVEYPGYGLLKPWGRPSEDALFRAAESALAYLVDTVGYDYSKVLLLGRSLGSGCAAYLASKYEVGGLILLNAFSSVRAVATAKVGKALAWLAFGDCFANDQHIAKVASPILLVHGSEDTTVPPSHSEELCRCALASPRKLMLRPLGMTHNSSMFEDPSFLVEPIKRFFNLSRGEHFEAPLLPHEAFEPRAPWRPPTTSEEAEDKAASGLLLERLTGQGLVAALGCGQARGHCIQQCPALAKLEGCDLTVPSGVTDVFNSVLIEDPLHSVGCGNRAAPLNTLLQNCRVQRSV